MSTSMAMKALEEGKKIRRKVWDAGDYIVLNKFGVIVDKLGHRCPILFMKIYYDWEVVK